MRTVWSFTFPGQLVFGKNSVDQLGDIAQRMNAGRVQIITDKILVDAGVVDQVSGPLKKSGVAVQVFDGGEADAPVHVVEQAHAMAKTYKPDLLLGLGGGSNMDLAKATATVMAHGGRCQDYAGDQVVPGPVFPLVLCPTTSGTGSEVTAAAVMSDKEAGTKFGILSNHLRPKVALVDPMLAVSCPPSVTADSGIDALTHAVESYTAIDNEEFPLPEGEQTVYQGRHPVSDLLAEQAIGLVGKFLRRAVADGNDEKAREGMALAATVSGMSFSNVGVAVVHALEYALAGQVGIPHGRGCGLLLPYVMRFNGSVKQDRMARIAELLGEDVSGLSESEAADRSYDAVDRLKSDIGIPARIGDVGVSADQITGMAETAFGVKRILRVNPRSVTADDLASILQTAL